MTVGFLIAVEGIDGSGKTTLTSYIKEVLEEFGFKAEILKEPGDSVYGKMIKSSEKRFPPEKELELFMLDRKEDVEKNILPRISRCISVVMDRYYYSTVAYQGALGIDPLEILRKNEEIAPKPDLTLIIDVSPETAMKRISNREKLSGFEEHEYLRKVREIYLSIESDEIKIIDGERSLNEVKEDCYDAVVDLISSRGSLFEMVLRKWY